MAVKITSPGYWMVSLPGSETAIVKYKAAATLPTATNATFLGANGINESLFENAAVQQKAAGFFEWKGGFSALVKQVQNGGALLTPKTDLGIDPTNDLTNAIVGVVTAGASALGIGGATLLGDLGGSGAVDLEEDLTGGDSASSGETATETEDPAKDSAKDDDPDSDPSGTKSSVTGAAGILASIGGWIPRLFEIILGSALLILGLRAMTGNSDSPIALAGTAAKAAVA
jgi:hypothetical protein